MAIAKISTESDSDKSMTTQNKLVSDNIYTLTGYKPILTQYGSAQNNKTFYY